MVEAYLKHFLSQVYASEISRDTEGGPVPCLGENIFLNFLRVFNITWYDASLMHAYISEVFLYHFII